MARRHPVEDLEGAGEALGRKRLSVFVHMAELVQIDGVGLQAAELPVAAGVEGLAGLAREEAEPPGRRLREVATRHPRTVPVPTATRLAPWIAEAKRLVQEAGAKA